MTQSFSGALGRRVVAADTAEEIGKVKTFVVDPSGRKIEQIQVDGSKRSPKLVDWADVQAFGSDVVLVVGNDRLHEVPDDDDRTTEVTKGKIDFVGTRILTTDGVERGTVDDVHFDEATGAIEGVLGDEAGRIDGARIRALGSYAMTIDA